MKSLFFAALASVALTAQADIPRRPSTEAEVVEILVEGNSALELFDALNVKQLRGSSLRTSSTVHKVFRSKDGLNQTVCTKTMYTIPASKKPTARCSVKQSQDGVEIPVFKPVIRLG